MIDFRYHLVSIVAVFLALAIGIVLGSTELQGKALDALSKTSNSLHSKLVAAQGENASYLAQVNADNEFAQNNEAVLVRGLLAGKRVVLITEPGAPDGMVNDLSKAVQLAGGSVTGQLALQPKFNDTSGATESSLNNINGTVAQADHTALTSGSNQETVNQQQAAQLLATAVLAASPSAPGPAPGPAKTLLNSYAQAGFLSVNGQPTQQPRATLAIVVPPASAPSDGASDQANQVLVAVTQELASASAATVVAGNVAGSGPGSAMATLRSASVSSQVSTVDNADTAAGATTVIQSLARQMAGGKPGAWGIEAGANGAGPSPAPTPGASVSASPTPTTSKKVKARK